MAKRSVLEVVIPEAISNPGSGVGQAVGEMTLEGRGEVQPGAITWRQSLA